jgi:hypothetical protein
MSTYSNIKMGEIFVVYGNPFSRKNWKKNIKQVLCIKYYKRVNFTSNFVSNTSTNFNMLPLKHFKDSLSLMHKNNSSPLNFNKINVQNHKKILNYSTFQEKDNLYNINLNKYKSDYQKNLNNDSPSYKFHFSNNISKSSSDIYKKNFKFNQFDDKLTLNYDKNKQYFDEKNDFTLDENNDSNENKITNISNSKIGKFKKNN